MNYSIEFFTVYTKLPEMVISASKDGEPILVAS